MKGWSIRQAAAARRNQNSAERAEIDRIRREHIERLDAEARGEAQRAPESADTAPVDETPAQPEEVAQSGALIPEEAVIPASDPVADAETPAQADEEAGKSDRFDIMPDDEIREFLASNGVRVASNWGRDALLRHARATEAKLASGEQS